VLPTLVLAAGLGTRLDPLTRLVAKPAVPLAGRTLIERILGGLRHHGIRDVVVNLHHRAESITGVIGDGTQLGLRVRYSWEPQVLGSAGGPRHALPLLDTATFLIINGDTLCEVALAPLLGAHRRTKADVTLALIPNPDRARYNGLILDDEHAVLGVVPKGRDDTSWHFVGVQVTQATVFAMLEDGVPAETIHGLYQTLLTDSPGGLRGWQVNAPFVDVGTPEDYLRAARSLGRPDAGGAVIEPGADVDPAARLADSVVWADARVEAGTDLTRCIVAGPVTVPRGCRATAATIVPAELVGADDDVEVIDGAAIFPFASQPAAHG
jgi:NDP-sugar pyrophosphorylase family protein